MSVFSKSVALAVAGACLCLLGCSFPTRTGYDRNLGEYKPVGQASAKQEQASTQEAAKKGDSHKTSAGKVKQAATKKSVPEPPAEKTSFEAYASKWLGTPYVYGANSTTGTDCSGYVMQVYKGYFDISLPHNAHMMYKDERGKSVSRGNLREADLIFFGSFWKISHVGIYLGGDRFIHASSSRGVIISNLNEKYYKNKYQGARRFK